MDSNQDNQSDKITIAEVARSAGVSIATVSRVMNHKPGVRKENVRRVEKVLADLGYSELMDKKNTVRDTITIGLIVPDIHNPWFPSLIKGVESVSRLHRLSLILLDSENDPEIESRNIASVVSRDISGLILVPTHKNSPAATELVDRKMPLVFLDRQIEGRRIFSVSSNNQDGAYQATKYLINLGHKRIVYIAGNELIDTELRRRAGYVRALNEAGLNVDEQLIIHGNYEQDKARRAVDDLIYERIPFTAIFASGDVMAYGARTSLLDHGLSIPEDISLIGYDDIQYSSLVGLTTVAQPAFELGKNAVLLLKDILAGRIIEPVRVELPTSIVLRDSCRPATNKK